MIRAALIVALLALAGCGVDGAPVPPAEPAAPARAGLPAGAATE